MGKGNRRNRKARKAAAQAQAAVVGGHRASEAPDPTHAPGNPAKRSGKAVRPTALRLSRGNWSIPHGIGKHDKPAVDTSSDTIGRLHDQGQITTPQEQAARHWQKLRAAYLCEMPDISNYKSCIAGGTPGYDDGDGDPEVIEEYRKMERKMTIPQRAEMLIVCEDGYRPRNIDRLRAALDAIGGN